MKRIVKFYFVAVCIIIFSCKSTTTDQPAKLNNQQKAEDAINSWMLENVEYPHYRPIVFGDLTARYERTNKSFQLATQIYEQEIIIKETGDTRQLDSLKRVLESNKGNLLGYIMLHKFQTTNLAGEVQTIERLFFLDSTLCVASELSPESFDLIMTEKVFYRIDPEN